MTKAEIIAETRNAVEKVLKATARNAIDLDYFLVNYANKIRLLDAKGDSIQILTPKGEFKITRTGFGEKDYKAEKI